MVAPPPPPEAMTATWSPLPVPVVRVFLIVGVGAVLSVLPRVSSLPSGGRVAVRFDTAATAGGDQEPRVGSRVAGEGAADGAERTGLDGTGPTTGVGP